MVKSSRLWDRIRQLLTGVSERRGEPGQIKPRMALFWCTTEELGMMVWTIDTQTKHFIDVGGSARPLQVSRKDIKWALSFSRDLDKAKAAEDRLSFTQAAEIYESLLPKIGASDYLLMRLGGCYANLGNFHRALLHLEKAASINPTNEQIQRWIRECYEARRKGEANERSTYC